MSEADRTDKESVELANEILRDFGISFSEAETNFKTSENFRKEFIDMSNKTSDENVAIIEELIQEYKTYNDLDGIQDLSIYVNALEHILAEREQKDKRIKELEEYISIAPNLDEMTATKYINIQREAYIRGKAEEQQRAEQIIYENYIPKQVVIDKIKENKQILDKTNDGNLRERLYIENGIMKELLEGEK